MKSVLIFACLFYLGQCGTEEDFKKLDSLRDEPLCTAAGGSCTFACPKEWLVEQKGLCPEQQRLGVECCYGISMKETRCKKHGGECIAEERMCGGPALYREATDCESGTKCCIFM
ncbi:hypothetical protein NE865_08771 [Phthorimaea operculella]|nr:hypothetical protein NE865_08771 [Phthorimaea operculella]